MPTRPTGLERQATYQLEPYKSDPLHTAILNNHSRIESRHVRRSTGYLPGHFGLNNIDKTIEETIHVIT